MNTVEQTVLRRLKRGLKAKVALADLVAFGSRARGDADSDSDLDVLVVVDGPAGDRVKDTVSECAWEAGFAKGIVVIPVTVSKREWQEGPERSSLLSLAVAREGIRV